MIFYYILLFLYLQTMRSVYICIYTYIGQIDIENVTVYRKKTRNFPALYFQIPHHFESLFFARIMMFCVCVCYTPLGRKRYHLELLSSCSTRLCSLRVISLFVLFIFPIRQQMVYQSIYKEPSHTRVHFVLDGCCGQRVTFIGEKETFCSAILYLNTREGCSTIRIRQLLKYLAHIRRLHHLLISYIRPSLVLHTVCIVSVGFIFRNIKHFFFRF